MLTQTQHHDLITNATKRTVSQWAIRFRVKHSQVAWILRKNGIKSNRKTIDLNLLRTEATTRTHQEWADYFGVSKGRMYVVCSREGIKVKGSYR